MTDSAAAIGIQAHLHHQYFPGLQLMVAVEDTGEALLWRIAPRGEQEQGG
jgi:hypothetical protein